MNISDLWDDYRTGKMTEQALDERVSGGARQDYWLTTVEVPMWFLIEAMEALNSTSGLRPVCVHERR